MDSSRSANRLVDLVLLGECKKNIDQVLAIIGIADWLTGGTDSLFHLFRQCGRRKGERYEAPRRVLDGSRGSEAALPRLRSKSFAEADNHIDDSPTLSLYPRLFSTDTCIVCDRPASCVYVAGRPDNVHEAVGRISESTK